jgi:TonB family protein
MTRRRLRLFAALGLLAAAPRAAAQTAPPVLLNPAEVAEAIHAAYPPGLRDAGVSAVVRVRLRVTAGGEATDLQVAESSDPRFSAPAVQAMRIARFRPARAGDRAVEYRLVVPVRFEAPPPGTPGGEIGVRAVLNPEELAAAIRREHPPRLREAGIGGGAMVRVTVGADGTVLAAEAVSASHPELGPAAERALRVARFRRADGTIVLRLPVRFDP